MSMVKIDNRESAHVRSRVKDLSKVPNIVSYTGLFACITPLSKTKPTQNDEDHDVYEPILIRDVDSLIANFGDPRVDPVKYIDLYTIMKIVGNGTSCYVSKVHSGDTGKYEIPLVFTPESQELAPYVFLNCQPDTLEESDESNESTSITLSGIPSELASRIVETFHKNDIYEITFINENDEDYEDDVINTEDVDSISVAENNDDTIIITLKSGKTFNSESSYTLFITSKGIIPLKCFNSNKGSDSSWLYFNGKMPEEAKGYKLFEVDINSHTSSDITSKIKQLVQMGDDTNAHIDAELKENTSAGKDYILVFIKRDITVNLTDNKALNIIGYSSLTDALEFKLQLTQANPKSVKAFYLNLTVIDEDNSEQLATAKVKLEKTTTNKTIVNTFNAAISPYIQFELADPNYANACMINNEYENSIVYQLLTKANVYSKTDNEFNNLEGKYEITAYYTDVNPEFNVSLNDYIAAQKQFLDHKYAGCIMADLTMPLSHTVTDPDPNNYNINNIDDYNKEYDPDTGVTKYTDPNNDNKIVRVDNFGVATPEERRAIHYHLKEIARERKDVNVILSAPYYANNDTVDAITSTTAFTVDEICNWVSSSDDYSDQFQYGSTNTVDYGEQSFYLEMYYGWLRMSCSYFDKGVTKAKMVELAPAGLVAQNILTSYRERGIWLPVAGDQGGVLNEELEVMYNPKAKAIRDQLVSYRINPIWDTGTRGIQIYGNETLNAGYTDLNAAHIARALVNIRSRVDEYTETLKFSLNNPMLWDKWKNHVSMYILEPFRSVGALAKYEVSMGLDTTTVEEIANRMIKGKIALTFYQSAEIFDLEFTVYSSATAFD